VGIDNKYIISTELFCNIVLSKDQRKLFMQQVSKVILFLREGKFAARAQRVRKSAE
jgi:hypothetical protein